MTALCRLNYDAGFGRIDRGKFGVKMPELRDVLKSMEGRRNKDKAVQPKPKPPKCPKRPLFPSDQNKWLDVLDLEDPDTLTTGREYGETNILLKLWCVSDQELLTLVRGRPRTAHPINYNFRKMFLFLL